MNRLERIARTTELAATAAEAERAAVRREQRRVLEASHRPIDHDAARGSSLQAARAAQQSAIRASQERLAALRTEERRLDGVVAARRRRAEQVAHLLEQERRQAADRRLARAAIETDDLVSSTIAGDRS